MLGDLVEARGGFAVLVELAKGAGDGEFEALFEMGEALEGGGVVAIGFGECGRAGEAEAEGVAGGEAGRGGVGRKDGGEECALGFFFRGRWGLEIVFGMGGLIGPCILCRAGGSGFRRGRLRPAGGDGVSKLRRRCVRRGEARRCRAGRWSRSWIGGGLGRVRCHRGGGRHGGSRCR